MPKKDGVFPSVNAHIVNEAQQEKQGLHKTNGHTPHVNGHAPNRFRAAADQAAADFKSSVPRDTPVAGDALPRLFADLFGRIPEIELTPPKPRPPGSVGPEVNGDLRAMAQLLTFLERDTPERAALVQAAGVDASTLDHEWMSDFGKELLRQAEAEEAGESGALGDKVYYRRKERQQKSDDLGICTRRLSEVEDAEKEWLWDQRFPIGHISMISGDPDLGKTWLVLDVLARITMGRDFPDGPNPMVNRCGFPRRNALWVSAEDDDATEIKPRLRLLRGDSSRVETFSYVKVEEVNKEKEREMVLRDLDLTEHLKQLDAYLYKNPLVLVVVLDPLAAFLGKTRLNDNGEVRRALRPLFQLANRHGIAILGINHLTKDTENGNAMYRSNGSIALTAAPRASWLVSLDPADKDKPKSDRRRLFTKIKCNPQEREVGGLAFHLPEGCGLIWDEGTIGTSADDALGVENPDAADKARPRAEAREWILDLLKDGPVPSDDAQGKAKSDGLCWRTVQDAKKELGVLSEKVGKGKKKRWQWVLPKPSA